MSGPADSHLLTSENLTEGLRTRRLGRRIICLGEIDSTNTHALETIARREGAAADGTVVFAERQTAGRGRLGRTWHSPAGASLMFTTLLHEPEHVTRAAFWTMAAALAVVEAIETATDVMPRIRWPNDIYVADRKLAGILVEARVEQAPGGPQDKTSEPASRSGMGRAGCADAEWANRARPPARSAFIAVGIGLNCLQHAGHFPEEIRASATSLEIESRRPVDRTVIARAVITALDHYFHDPATVRDDDLAAKWCRHSADIGQRVTLISAGRPFAGSIIDIHPQTGLLLQLDSGHPRHFDPATTSRL